MPLVITRYDALLDVSDLDLIIFQKQRIVPRHLQLAIRNDEE